MVDEQKKLWRKIANLFGKIGPDAQLQRQADNVGRPSHQLDKVVVPLRRFSNIHGNRQTEDRVALGWRKLGYTIGHVFSIEPKGTSTTVKLRRVGHPQHRFEPESKAANLARVPLARHVGKHECSDTILVDRFSIISAVEMILCKADKNALTIRCIGKRIRAVLDQLEELSMSVTAMSDIMFVVGVLGDEIRLLTVCAEGVLRLFRNETANLTVGISPIGLPDGLGQTQRGVRTIELTTYTLGEIVLLLHLPDSYSSRSFRVVGRAEMIRIDIRLPV